MWVNDLATVNYVAAKLNIAKTAVYLYFVRGLCLGVNFDCIVSTGKPSNNKKKNPFNNPYCNIKLNYTV